MPQNTNAYLAFKAESERLTNLVALFSHAVPVLRRVLNSAQATSLIPLKPADSFPHDKADGPTLLQWAKDYEQDLARMVVLTVFSNFEVYIRAVLLEVFARQGGIENFIAISEKRSTRLWKSLPADILQAKSKLQTFDDKGKADRSRKYSKVLGSAGFPFPPDLLAVYGARKLAEKLQPNPSKAFRASEIPDLLTEALLFNLTLAEKRMYEELRLLRNNVGHASPTVLTIHDAIKKTTSLRKWASRIDAHIEEHFLVLAKYAV
jgi:hypothetical protein